MKKAITLFIFSVVNISLPALGNDNIFYDLSCGWQYYNQQQDVDGVDYIAEIFSISPSFGYYSINKETDVGLGYRINANIPVGISLTKDGDKENVFDKYNLLINIDQYIGAAYDFIAAKDMSALLTFGPHISFLISNTDSGLFVYPYYIGYETVTFASSLGVASEIIFNRSFSNSFYIGISSMLSLDFFQYTSSKNSFVTEKQSFDQIATFTITPKLSVGYRE